MQGLNILLLWKITDLKCAIDKLLYLMRNHFKHKIGLAIYIISEETGFSTRELSHHLYKIKVLKRDKEVERIIRREPKIDYRKVYHGYA